MIVGVFGVACIASAAASVTARRPARKNLYLQLAVVTYVGTVVALIFH